MTRVRDLSGKALSSLDKWDAAYIHIAGRDPEMTSDYQV
jgi:hypothetical protein